MKAAKKRKLELMVGLSVSVAICLGLVGFTVPKVNELESLRSEWSKIEPLAERGRLIQQIEAQEFSASPEPGRDPRILLPSNDNPLEYLIAVLRMGVEVGVGEIPYHQVEPPAAYPPKASQILENVIPTAYNEHSNPARGSKIARHPIRLEFRTGYLGLLNFCRQLQVIPRFAQIVSIQLESDGSTVDVNLLLEVYSLHEQAP